MKEDHLESKKNHADFFPLMKEDTTKTRLEDKSRVVAITCIQEILEFFCANRRSIATNPFYKTPLWPILNNVGAEKHGYCGYL